MTEDSSYRPDYSRPPTSSALALLQEGHVDAQQVIDGLLKLPESKYTYALLDGLPLYVELLEQHGKAPELKAVLTKSVKEGGIALERIPELPFFDNNEKRELIRSGLKQNPEGALATYADVLLQYLPAEEIRAEFDAIVDTMTAANMAAVIGTLPESVLSTDEKRQHLRTASILAPAELHEYTGLIAQIFDQEEAAQVTQRVVAEAIITRHSQLLERAADWLPMMGSPDEQREALLGVIDRAHGPGFLIEYVANSDLQAIVPLEEMKQILISRITGDSNPLNPRHFFYEDGEKEAFVFVMGGEESIVVQLAEAALEMNPQATIRLVVEMPNNFSLEQKQKLLMAVAVYEPVAVIQEVGILYRLTAEQRAQLFARGIEIDPGNTIIYLTRHMSTGRIVPEEARAFLDPLAIENPALMYLFDKYEALQPKSELLRYMRSSDELRSVAPEWFNEFFKEFDRANENGREIVMKEAAMAYRNIATIRAHAPEVLSSVARIAGNAKQQRDALIMLAFSAKHNNDAGLGVFSQSGSMSELYEATYRTLEKHLGVKLGEDARRQLEPALGPFTVYTDAFSQSADHTRILSQFAAANGPVAFRDFRLITNTAEALGQAKAEGLLPQSLTLDQHAIWREDDEIVNRERLQTSAGDVSDRIRSIIQLSADIAGIKTSVKDFDTVSVNALTQEIKELGVRMGELHRMHIINPEMTSTERAEQADMIAAVQQELAQRQVLMSVVRLHTLSDQEIVAGNLINSSGKQQQTLSTLLDRAHKAAGAAGLPQEASMMFGEIGRVLEDYGQQTADEKDLRIAETIDQLVTLEVGAKPIGSCQDYATGIYRECLLGYTEPGTKIIAVYDGASLIARSILRLAENEDGSSVLHVERTYSQSASPVVLERTLELAARKAQKMGIPVYLAPMAKDSRGQRVGIKPPKGYEIQPEYRNLRVQNTRAPKVYVDSGLGAVPKGPYRIIGAARLALTA